MLRTTGLPCQKLIPCYTHAKRTTCKSARRSRFLTQNSSGSLLHDLATYQPLRLSNRRRLTSIPRVRSGAGNTADVAAADVRPDQSDCKDATFPSPSRAVAPQPSSARPLLGALCAGLALTSWLLPRAATASRAVEAPLASASGSSEVPEEAKRQDNSAELGGSLGGLSLSQSLEEVDQALQNQNVRIGVGIGAFVSALLLMRVILGGADKSGSQTRATDHGSSSGSIIPHQQDANQDTPLMQPQPNLASPTQSLRFFQDPMPGFASSLIQPQLSRNSSLESKEKSAQGSAGLSQAGFFPQATSQTRGSFNKSSNPADWNLRQG
ncbi:hypothetical protein WJX74_000398 [Apatococcus lobatus]|uniref:Transmembrane protein n=1 Tax=Apatococcus lobatus TaxID=904363 RepID=A0AAW1SF64_9CHLO